MPMNFSTKFFSNEKLPVICFEQPYQQSIKRFGSPALHEENINGGVDGMTTHFLMGSDVLEEDTTWSLLLIALIVAVAVKCLGDQPTFGCVSYHFCYFLLVFIFVLMYLLSESSCANIAVDLKAVESLFFALKGVNTTKLVFATTGVVSKDLDFTVIEVDIQDSLDDEEDTRSSQEYMNDLEEEYQARALLAKSKSFKSSVIKNNSLITKAYEWEEEVSSDDNKMVEVKVLMALADDENVAVGKESAKNAKWVKISMRKVHIHLEMEDTDDKKSFLDYLCIDLNYIEEQINNLLSKHRDIVHELKTCKEQLIVLKQAKLVFLTMQHVNTKILKENQNLRKELKELINITETWLNSSNKVIQYISEQIPSQKKRILRLDQLTKEPSSSGQTDLLFLKSLADDIEVSILAVSQIKATNPLVAITDSSASEHDLANESSVCSTPFPPLEKIVGVEHVSEPMTIKSILKSKSTFKAETLKGVIIKESSSAPAKVNKDVSASKINSAPAGKLKNVKTEDDLSLSIVMKELNIINYK
ncbi:hypothetical protein Tco_0849470 [Tanacetum coccineum]